MKLLAGVLLLSGGVAAAQLPSTSPVKLGLWQSESSTKMSLDGSQEADAQNDKAQACVTAETWKGFIGNMDSMKGCQQSHESYSGRTYSFDISCPKTDSSAGSATGHFEMVFDTDEAAHATMKLRLDTGNGKAMTMSSAMTAKYMGASCGNIKPGETKSLQ